jgi:arginine/ornithine permease
MANFQPENELQRTMKSRHLFMIALGGVIGTGFFLGSGSVIGQAGPVGAILSYLLGGLVMYLVMLCLGELSVAMPSSGSFQDYTTRFVGPATGFVIGWLYWFGWAVTVALELVSMGILMKRWFPNSSIATWCILFALILFMVNALSVRIFAETEFWFASIKVMMILLFVVLGGAAMFGLIPLKGGEPAPMLSHFVQEGWFPNGIGAILLTMLVVNFSFQGTELIGIASGESENPEKTIPKAIHQTVWRTILFFGLAIFVLVGLIPWREASLLESPFVTAFAKIGIPYAADIVNFVILTAFLSVANSGLYATVRMLYSLSQNGMAPKMLGKVNKKGVPFHALLISIGVTGLSLLSARYSPNHVYMMLLSISGIPTILAWMSISASQFFFRRSFLQQGGRLEELKFKTPFYPIVPLLSLVLNFIVLASLWFDPATQPVLYFGMPAILLCYGIYFLFVVRK